MKYKYDKNTDIPATEKFSNRIKANPQTPPNMDNNPNG